MGLFRIAAKSVTSRALTSLPPVLRLGDAVEFALSSPADSGDVRHHVTVLGPLFHLDGLSSALIPGTVDN